MIAGKIAGKSLSSNPDYTLLTENGWVAVKQDSTQTDYGIGEFIQADSENAGEIKPLNDAKVRKGVEDFLERNSRPRTTTLLVDDEAMRAFAPALAKGAEFVARKLLELTPALIRFNDDCDGISAGLLVKKSLEQFVEEKKIPLPKTYVKDKQCNSAVYESGEAAWDSMDSPAERFGKKPLLFLLDFGANPESVEGLEKAKENFEIVVIDHHVYSEKAKSLADVFLNPLEFGGISSHTTGLIAFEFARKLSHGEEKYALYSMQSDKSVFWDKVDRKEALVLDFLSRENLSLAQYEKALKDEVQYHYAEASAKISAGFEKAFANAKSEKVGGALLVSVNLEGVTRKGEFPPKGKILNKIQEHFELENPLAASVGFDSNTIQFRVSKALHAKGFKATRVINEVKKDYPGLSGGGHEQAAAMRFDSELFKNIFEKTMQLCRWQIESAK